MVSLQTITQNSEPTTHNLSVYVGPLIVTFILLASAVLGGLVFLVAVLGLAVGALVVLLRQFGLLGLRPSVGAAVVITCYLTLSGQQLRDTLTESFQIGVVLAVIVVITLSLRLGEHDTREAVLNWLLTIAGSVYLGLLLSYLLRLYNLQPDLAYANEAGQPRLLTSAYAQLRSSFGLAPLGTAIGWPLSPPPVPAVSPSAQWVMLGLLLLTLLFVAVRRIPFAPLALSLVTFALSWLVGWAVAVIVGVAFVALNLASLTQPLIVSAAKLRGGWLLALAHHLALLGLGVYYAIVWWS